MKFKLVQKLPVTLKDGVDIYQLRCFDAGVLNRPGVLRLVAFKMAGPNRPLSEKDDPDYMIDLSDPVKTMGQFNELVKSGFPLPISSSRKTEAKRLIGLLVQQGLAVKAGTR